ncbi:MAG TPA: hypothetical protein VHL09_15015 [Dehalococcoidia bacterium]|nr:hypothetical protein [Dehalococcoidia bacterium]
MSRDNPLPPDRLEDGAVLDPRADAARLLTDFRAGILGGRHWYVALLETIGRWRLPVEEIDGRRFQYLIADEALDWLLLAERLVGPVADLIPESDWTDLLFLGVPPVEVPEDVLKSLLGPTKYRAYLNYLYGVELEEALIVAVQQEIDKERRSRAYHDDRRTSESLHQRLYGKTLEDLRQAFHAARGQGDRDTLSQTEWKEFVYWLFKHRLRYWDKARIASDTRKAIRAFECLRNERRRHLARPFAPAADVVDAVLIESQVLSTDPFQPAPSTSAFDLTPED